MMDTPPRAGDLEPGRNAQCCRVHVGGLLFLARCTRPDISYAVGCIARLVDKWSHAADAKLHRLMEYINATADVGIEFAMHDADYGQLFVEAAADADHGGDPDTRRSTSGWSIILKGPSGSRACLAWGSKLQGATARSTGHSEVAAVNDMITRDILVLLGLVERVYGGRVRTNILDDSDVARTAIRGSNHSKLRYMAKHPGISLAFLRDVLEQNCIELERVDSADNVADIFTKALRKDVFLKHFRALGLV